MIVCSILFILYYNVHYEVITRSFQLFCYYHISLPYQSKIK